MKLILSTLLISASLSASVLAADLPNFDAMSNEERRAAMENMTPEQRKQFHDARKEQWNAMSDAEKVKLIEEKRANMRAERDARWDAMSDAEKIKHAEEKMQQKMQHGKDGKGHKRPEKGE